MDLPASFVLIRDSKIILWYQLMKAPERRVLQNMSYRVPGEIYRFLQGSWRNLQDFYRVPREVHRIFTGFLEKFTGFLQDSWRNLQDFYTVPGEIYRVPQQINEVFPRFLGKFT